MRAHSTGGAGEEGGGGVLLLVVQTHLLLLLLRRHEAHAALQTEAAIAGRARARAFELVDHPGKQRSAAHSAGSGRDGDIRWRLLCSPSSLTAEQGKL
ncbi:unnamed protein product [Lampetra fluviatilis]